MLRTNLVVTGLAALVALTLACSQTSPTVISPSGTLPGGTNAISGSTSRVAGAPDGSTAKLTAPIPQSPPNEQKLTDSPPTLVATASTGKFSVQSMQYRFQIFNNSGALVQDSGLVNSPSYKATGSLDFNARHVWRVRGETQGVFGPWSASFAFITPEGGYIRGNELYDPLINGKTVGEIHGPVTFIPGVGAKLEDFSAYISYELPQTLTEGEFSILATNVRTHTEGSKTKILAMSQGYDDIVTNDRRMTLEKRSDGTVAWRFITHDDQIDTGSNERRVVQFNLTDTFFFGTSWRNNAFNVSVRRGGPNGEELYGLTKTWNGRPYDPTPHVIFVGSPNGRSGLDSASVPDIIVRHVWVSSRPRPASANQ